MQNAKITKADIFIEDHNILTYCLTLDYGGSGQGFGMYDLQYKEGAKHHIRGILEALKTYNWSDLVGKNIRVEATHSKILKIGHIIEDSWFDPEDWGENEEESVV